MKAMKSFKQILFTVAILLTGLTLTACSSDSDDDTDIDIASQISGTYSGKLTTNGVVLEDAYVVGIRKISNTVVSLSADFLPNSSCNFNVTNVSGQFILENSNLGNINISVTGKKLIISYTNSYGNLVSFNGQRD